MLVARLLTGVSIGGFWAFAAGLGLRLVPEGSVGRATSIILAGVSVASVLGVPVATFISSFAGWRTAFVAMGCWPWPCSRCWPPPCRRYRAWAARNPKSVLVTLAVLMALSTAALPLIGLPLIDLPLIMLVVWGLGYGGVRVTLRFWIMRSGGGEMGTALFVGAFNVSIALGSFVGGRVVDGVSISAVMWVGAALAVAGAAVAGISGRSRTAGS